MQARMFSIITFGCQMNVNDSRWLAETLKSRGFQEGPLPDASLVIVNTCSVREKPELKVHSTLGRIRQETESRGDVVVAVCGCVAQQLGEKLYSYSPQVRLVAGSDNLGAIPALAEELFETPGRKICLTTFSEKYPERTPAPGETAKPVSYVNIMQGCDNFCTYCIVPYTRGRQKSRPAEAVVDECRMLVNGGALDITLLGQNVNAYGKDHTSDGTSFASLLTRVASIPGLERVRYVSPHPKDMTEEDIALFGSLPNLCPRLHLPVQAGSDRVLKRMNRRYTSSQFLALVEALHKARPDIALSTDLIVGFPGETEEDFLDTLELVRRSNFVSSFSFCYSDRPGTRASLFDDKIAPDVQQERLLRLQALQDELTQKWLDTRVGDKTVLLVEQKSPRQDSPELSSWQGRDPYGAPVHVLLPQGKDYTGHLVPVTIIQSLKHSLKAQSRDSQ